MRLVAWTIFVGLSAAFISAPLHAQSFDDDLKVYAVSVIDLLPFKTPLSGYGIYLGKGAFITAAHVVGRWSLFINPRLLIAGQEIPAKVVKRGSFEQTDLALLTVDETLLPVSLLLRRNPLCKLPPMIGANVIIVYPERTARSRVISPKVILPASRTRFGSLINDVQVSGSGAFDAEKKCLLGIMSASVSMHDYRGQNGRAGYFVPASKIAEFLPAEFRF
jgi:hypothetical protein